MRRAMGISVLAACAGLAGGCTHEAYVRTEGVTTGAGNAMAANTVMQMVDPWADGVQETRLSTPAVRPGGATAALANDAAEAKSTQSSSDN